MMIVLTVAVSATATVRDALLTQYYDQLAEVAGEAGVAYAKACLASNANKPTWTTASPLTPQTDCTGTVVNGYPQYVMSNGDVRSSFSVPLPTTDASGNAVTIANSGYVQLLRTSTGAVWKTYNQPTAQAAVVPDLCSGTATSDLGWNNAVITTGSSFAVDPAASAISIANSAINSGPVYYRKDFTVTTPGTYTLSTLNGSDNGTYYLDGQSVATNSSGTTSSVNITISSAGCHALTVEIDNTSLAPSSAWFMLSLKSPGASSVVAHSDTSWRVTSGNTEHYSQLNYWESPSVWSADRVFGMWNNTTLPWGGGIAGWNTTSGDNLSQYIGNNYGASGTNYPASEYTYLRNTRGFYLATSTDVAVSSYCDDRCYIYLDGSLFDTSNGANGAERTTVTLSAGWHDFGVRLWNASNGNVSAFIFAAVRTSDGAVLMRSDSTWDAAAIWESTANEYYSYDGLYSPLPSIKTGIAKGSLLVVAGGGGGGSNAPGGGGAGGLISYNGTYTFSVGTNAITVGTGGAPATSTTVTGSNGTSSSFGTITASGGGGGASRDGGNQGQAGGSGGGGAGASAAPRQLGGAGVSGQGNAGGSGTTPDAGCNSVGGGGGGAGGIGGFAASTVGGNGGPGLITYFTGAPVIYGMGGAGTITCAGSVSGVSDAGGSANGVAATANRGAGGGGAVVGGSGAVIVSFPTGSITVSATGTYTTATFNGNTVYTFTGSGTFTVNSINI